MMDNPAPLHKKGECRHQITIKKKSGEFCHNCKHNVDVNRDSDCLCCGLHIARPRTYKVVIKRFNKACDDNREILECHFPIDTPFNFVMPIKIDLYTYNIRILDLQRFSNLMQSDQEDDKYEKFFKKLKKRYEPHLS